MPGEFEIIRRYFAPAAQPTSSVKLGLGDDCALVQAPNVDDLIAISTDTLVEGVHFLPDIEPEDLAWRLVAAAVSDLAAMGAEPLWLSLALTLPDSDRHWLEGFQKGLKAALQTYGIALVGGDTTSGRIRVLTAHVHGSVPSESALTRAGAKPGDLIYVSGTLGDSRAGLELLQDTRATLYQALDNHARSYLVNRFLRPTPRLVLGKALRGLATATIDISDGLLADLTHITERSGVSALVNIDKLPISLQLQQMSDDAQARQWAATGGEDFELCFTVPASRKDEIDTLAQTLDLDLTRVGQVGLGSGLKTVYAGALWDSEARPGFDHFGETNATCSE